MNLRAISAASLQRLNPLGRNRREGFIWLCSGIVLILILIAPGDGSSFHDFSGGRFPVADGFDWVKASLDAASGYKTDYGAKRPWNLPFNVFALWAGDRINTDSLLGSLAIKRLLALGSVATLLTALRPHLTLASSLGLAALLLGTLPSLDQPPLHDFLGQGLGYTNGTELNTFIIVNIATAWLILALDRFHLGRFRRGLLPSSFGLALLTLAAQGRPGTLFLLPSLVILLLVAAGRAGPSPAPGGWEWRRISALLLVSVLAWALVSGGQLALEKGLARSACGSVGANTGVSIMGIASGQTFREAEAETREARLAGCGRALSKQQLQIGLDRIRADPRPLLGLLGRNARDLASMPTITAAMVILSVFVLLWAWQVRSTRRQPTGHCPVRQSDPPPIVWLAACGTLSILLFQIPFLGEAGMRPSIPYAVFPFLILVRGLDRTVDAFLPSTPQRRAQPPVRPAVPLVATAILAASMAMGMVLIQRQALLGVGYQAVSGALPVSPLWLGTWTRYQAISPSMAIMYRLEVSPEAAAMDAGNGPDGPSLCLRYRRRALPWGLPYGLLSVVQGPC